LNGKSAISSSSLIPRKEKSNLNASRRVLLLSSSSEVWGQSEREKGADLLTSEQSPLFDNSRWQIFLYPNSGHEQYVSLYISAEPTTFEKERGASELALFEAPKTGKDGKEKEKEKDKAPWRRDGQYKFTFEVSFPFFC
jgi:hypothetical protein